MKRRKKRRKTTTNKTYRRQQSSPDIAHFVSGKFLVRDLDFDMTSDRSGVAGDCLWKKFHQTKGESIQWQG